MLTRAGKGRGRGVVQPMGVGDSSAPSIAPSLSQFGTPTRESAESSRDSHGKAAETPTPVRSGRYVTSTTPLGENSPPPQPAPDRYTGDKSRRDKPLAGHFTPDPTVSEDGSDKTVIDKVETDFGLSHGTVTILGK